MYFQEIVFIGGKEPFRIVSSLLASRLGRLVFHTWQDTTRKSMYIYRIVFKTYFFTWIENESLPSFCYFIINSY